MTVTVLLPDALRRPTGRRSRGRHCTAANLGELFTALDQAASLRLNLICG